MFLKEGACREKHAGRISEMDTTSLNSIFSLPVYVYEAKLFEVYLCT